MTWPLAFVIAFGCLTFLAIGALIVWKDDREEARAHDLATHNATAAARQGAVEALIKRAESADTEVQRLTEKVTQLQNRVGRA